MRRVLLLGVSVVCGIAVALAGLIWTGPFMSGALFLTRGTGRPPRPHDLPASYVPLHKGHVDVSGGLYIREDEDLVLHGSPSFMFTRTYLSGDRVSRHFGIGTTDNAEWYLIGDGNTFQWAELILADGGRIHFDRISSGAKYDTALFLHRRTPTGFYDARLGWTGLGWAMRFADGALATFKDCSPGGRDTCSLVGERDSDGHRLRFHRDGSGRLRAIESETERMTLEYDAQGRVSSAALGGSRVEYGYDGAGRLRQVRESSGVTREYTYGSRDEMLTIREPGWFIENTYDGDLRVVRQVTHLDRGAGDGGARDLTMTFGYKVWNRAVAETDIGEYDGTHTVYRFNSQGYTELEIHDAARADPVLLSVERDGQGQYVTGLTVRCTVDGRRVSRTVPMTDGLSEETAKEVLMAGTCLTPRQWLTSQVR